MVPPPLPYWFVCCVFDLLFGSLELLPVLPPVPRSPVPGIGGTSVKCECIGRLVQSNIESHLYPFRSYRSLNNLIKWGETVKK